jgi:hypothetical protein
VDVTAIGGLRLGTITAIPGGGRTGGQFAVGQDQLLEGTVVSIDHDSVVIQVGGQRMSATTDASVRPGDVLRLLVRETGPDQVLMQIVGRGGTVAPQTRLLGRGELANELTNVGVAPDEESLQVAGELLARGQPLTARNVLDVRTALARVAQARSESAQPPTVEEASGEIPAPTAQSPRSGGAAAETQIDRTDLRAAVFLKSQGLPVTPAAVQIVRQAWASHSALGQEVEQLRDGLASLAAKLVDVAEPEPAKAPQATSAPPVLSGEAQNESVTEDAVSVPRPLATPAPQSAPVELLAPSPGTPAEEPESVPASPPSHLAPAADSPSTEPASPASTPEAPSEPRPTPTQAPLSRLLSAVTQTLDHLQLIDDQAVAAPRPELAERIRQVVAEQGTPVEAKLARVLAQASGAPHGLDRTMAADLRTTLTELVDQVGRHLDQPAARLPHEALRDLAAVRDHAEALLGRVELQQMSNAAAVATPTTANATNAESYLMFQVPIPGGQSGQTAQIRIRQDDQGATKRIDPKNLHVVFQFEMQHLGTVRVSLRVLDRHVSCQMGSTDPAATAMLDQHADELREGLTGLGYAIDDLKCATLTPADLRAADDAPAPPPRPALRVDARA